MILKALTHLLTRTLASILVIAPVLSSAITLEWDPNSEPSVRGYRVYSGRQSRVYDTVLDVTNRTVIQMSALPGTTYFAVTAYNADNLESDFSEEVSYTAAGGNVPIGTPDTYFVTNNLLVTVGVEFGVLANDSDPDGDALGAVLVNPPSNGVLTFAGNGSFAYTPALNFTGVDGFTYRASDGSNASSVVTVTLVVVAEPDSEDCSTCFAALDAILTARAVDFPQVVAARATVSTNEACPQYGVLVFGAVSRSMKTISDADMIAAMGAAAGCLMAQIRGEMAGQMAFAAELAPSRWTKSASNEAAAASRKLDRALAAPKNLQQVTLMNAAANSVLRIGRFLGKGDLAPLELANRQFAASVKPGGQSVDATFEFGDESFVIFDGAGTSIAGGNYTYSRAAWNKGTLILVFDDETFGHPAGEPVGVQLKFGRARARMSSPILQGYFTMH
jgi:hypothetical protein